MFPDNPPGMVPGAECHSGGKGGNRTRKPVARPPLFESGRLPIITPFQLIPPGSSLLCNRCPRMELFNHPDIRRRKRSCIAIRHPGLLPSCPNRPTHIPFGITRPGNGRVSMVEASGFEPERTEPKSVMLPLHHASITVNNYISMN